MDEDLISYISYLTGKYGLEVCFRSSVDDYNLYFYIDLRLRDGMSYYRLPIAKYWLYIENHSKLERALQNVKAELERREGRNTYREVPIIITDPF